APASEDASAASLAPSGAASVAPSATLPSALPSSPPAVSGAPASGYGASKNDPSSTSTPPSICGRSKSSPSAPRPPTMAMATSEPRSSRDLVMKGRSEPVAADVPLRGAAGARRQRHVGHAVALVRRRERDVERAGHVRAQRPGALVVADREVA